MAEKANWLEYWVDPQTWKFRGDFEGMYRDFADPWECRKNVSELRRDISLMLLMRDRRYRRILDVGCGLGAFTERLRGANGEPCSITGVDVSATAIDKARQQYPACSFEVRDITVAPLPGAPGEWDLVLVSEVLWYVLPKLPDLLRNIATGLSADGVLFIQQYYPKEQRFGAEYLQSPAELYTRYLQPAGFRRQHEFDELLADGQVQLISLVKSDREE
jgi:2-polyprenyl-3-methyl-5-hydroxy-6-metoxy-1,4-benzoquinol methylase